MNPPETIKTTRLTLRRLRADDASAIFATYAQDREVTRFLTWRPHQSVKETREFVRGCIEAWRAGTEFIWAIVLDGGGLIGGIALRPRDFKADVGYVIARPYWGKGFATETLRSVVSWALDQPQIYRVWAVCDVENPASARVMEKAGMLKEGILRMWIRHPQAGDAPRDCFCYSIAKSDA